MAGNIQVPNNIEDKTVLKRFLTDLVLGINGNSLFSGSIQEQNAALVEILQNNPTLNFLDITSKLTELRKDILTYVEDNIETVILQNTEDIAVIAEQFGTFYNQALAASWYGLSVKAGGAIAGLEIGSLDHNVTTPGDESSYFRIIANNFILGRAYEDLTQEEKNYLATNNLPNFGTVYNAQKQPVPALITSWDSASQVYKHYFNGIVQFSNIANADYANAINNGTTTINGGKITTNSLAANTLMPATDGTTVWSGGALISQNFNGNAVGSIGSPTQGFRLSSNASGTSTDPNIYGAYIKGGTIEGATITGTSLTINDVKVRTENYSDNYGPILITKGAYGNAGTVTLDTLYWQGYSSGYLSNRVCKSVVTLVLTLNFSAAHGNAETMQSLSGSIQVSNNNGSTWITIASRSISFLGGSSSSLAITYNISATNNIICRSSVSTSGSLGATQSLLLNVVNGQ